LKKAQEDGLRFITDSDARAAGGAHALAHLWDNGKTAAEELNAILELRAQAISNFSKDNIKTYEPYSVLEDVFVPLYFYHRFQVEGATKVIGGLDYNYAIKGDGQLTSKSVDVTTQKETLDAILKTLSAENLAVPKDKLDLFPPRAYGYNRSRESFKGKTGVAFDPFSAANTASDMTLKFLLHPQRANRLILQRSLDDKQLSLEDVIDTLLKHSFDVTPINSYYTEIQHQINANVMKYLMNLATHDDSYFQTKAIANKTIMRLATKFLNFEAIDIQYGIMIKEFYEHPEKFKLKSSPKIPDGSPIGSAVCNYNLN
jgi:hypothetical protein